MDAVVDAVVDTGVMVRVGGGDAEVMVVLMVVSGKRSLKSAISIAASSTAKIAVRLMLDPSRVKSPIFAKAAPPEIERSPRCGTFEGCRVLTPLIGASQTSPACVA